MAYDMMRKKGLGFAGGGAQPLPTAPRVGGGAAPMRPAPRMGGGAAALMDEEQYGRGTPTYGDDGSSRSTRNQRPPRDPDEDEEGWMEDIGHPPAEKMPSEPNTPRDDMEIEEDLATAVNSAATQEEAEAAIEDWKRRMRARGVSEETIERIEAGIRDTYADGQGVAGDYGDD